ncbi:copper homeostasis protein CutC [Tautonia plasticadhaerens]|uniref:PF03932 family protein CutC n=1 Tax=Tautonia plasticadhaerens TaxID=2527974 RepID=A0A518GZ94_9BACT|nr:copper homeostasis protein CutC [Tautonia plasticadhaerens]QDV33917.1 Copper homeostasis protein CutC [Tautonia plasticadhaerens]
MPRSITVEICVEGLGSALAAGEGGADRVELCEDLAVGGVTPSAGAIEVACRRLAIPVQVLIRPRGGDFDYSEAEFEAMRLDIALARDRGASGVVLGVLRPDGRVDEPRNAALIREARPMSVTFHRAFDEVPDPMAALDTLIGLGVDRVLTSGRADSARSGVKTLRALVSRSAGRLAVLGGGRVTIEAIPDLIGAGLSEIHVGSAACRGGRTDPDLVRRIVSAARLEMRRAGEGGR